MRGNDFLDKMELVDPIYVEAADTMQKRKKNVWMKWAAIAACFALIIYAGIHFFSKEKAEEHLDLPILSVSDDTIHKVLMGYEGYMAYDILELVNANPWNEDMKLFTLPVYENALTYDEIKGITTGADFEKMQNVLLEMANRIGVEAEWMTIVEERPDEEIEHKIGDKMERVFEPVYLMIEKDGVKISVGRTLHTSISFDPAIVLPSKYNFTHYASYKDKIEVAEYLQNEYKNLIGMSQAQKNIYGGEYNIYGQQEYSVSYFDISGTDIEKIINYNFNQVRFYCNDEGKLDGISISQPELSEKIGDYPIITSKQAMKLLSEGKYITTVPYEIFGLECVKKAELIYLGGKYYMPYYRFYVELPEDEHENGLKTYGAYYVPAVEKTYLSN